jgi:hypothetical protein
MWDPKRTMPAFWQRMKPVIPVAYERIMEAVRPGETVLVGGAMAFWVRLAQEKTGAPTATIHPAPYAILSAEAPPVLGLIPWLGRLPARAVRGVLSAAEMLLLDSPPRGPRLACNPADDGGFRCRRASGAGRGADAARGSVRRCAPRSLR